MNIWLIDVSGFTFQINSQPLPASPHNSAFAVISP